MQRKENEQKPPAIPLKEYTIPELEEFGKFLESFRETKTLNNGEVVKVLNLKDAGASAGIYKKVINHFPASEYKKEPYDVVDYLVLPGRQFEEFHNKYEQWQRWRDKQEYIEGKKVEQYEKMAEAVGTRWKGSF